MEKEIILYRKAYKKLLEWKNRSGHYPLIIRGLRQTGKSYLAQNFAFQNYGEQYCPVLDFRHKKDLDSLFQMNPGNGTVSIEDIINNIQIYFPDKKIEKGKTCIVMDEIGDSLFAREMFKVFKNNSGYDIIATGSLLGLSEIRGEVKNTPIGYEEYLDLKPLDFEEFLLASGVKKETIEILKDHVMSHEEVSETYSKVFHAHLLRYILVGGMPKAVTLYLQTQDLLQVRNYLVNLSKSYQDDFGKIKDKNGKIRIDPTLLVRTLRAYSCIPDQLAKENKKFKYSLVPGGGRSSEFSDAIARLEKVNLINLAHNVRAIEKPLAGNAITEEFKIYPSDIGLLMASFPLSIMREVLQDDLEAYKGAIYEGLAADMLYKSDFPLYYYSNTLKHLENDFLIEDGDGISVIESKANNGKMASSRLLKSGKTPYHIKNVYKLVAHNFGKGDFFITIPQFAFPFLLEKIQEEWKKGLKVGRIESL